MAKEPVAKFSSENNNLLICRDKYMSTQAVGGEVKNIERNKESFRFAPDGNLTVYSEEEAEELREHRLFGKNFIEVPLPVRKVADKEKKKEKPKEEAKAEPEEAEEPEVEETIVEEVDGYNSAIEYMKNEFGLEHKEVNSKEKLFEQAGKFKLVFPNYPKEENLE